MSASSRSWIPGMALVVALAAGGGAAAPAWAQGGQLRIALQGDTSDVDLHLTTHYVSRVALLNVYEMLYALGEDLSVRPMLVEATPSARTGSSTRSRSAAG
jgi:hypothetical protein